MKKYFFPSIVSNNNFGKICQRHCITIILKLLQHLFSYINKFLVNFKTDYFVEIMLNLIIWLLDLDQLSKICIQ